MKPLSLQEAKRLALAQGATLEVGGQVFNANRVKASAGAPQPAQPATPVAAPMAPPPLPTPAQPIETMMRIADVAKLLADRDASWAAEMDKLRAQFIAMNKVPVQWSFKPKYDSNNALKEIVATPVSPGHSSH